MKNESFWEQVELQPPFQQSANDRNYDECWAKLEAFQQVANKQINARALIALDRLLRSVYTAGYAAGHKAAEYDDSK